MKDFLNRLHFKKQMDPAARAVEEVESPKYTDIKKEREKTLDKGTPWEVTMRSGEDTAVVKVPTRSGHLQELAFSVIQKDSFFESDGTVEEIMKRGHVIPHLQTPVLSRWEGQVGYAYRGEWPQDVAERLNISLENFAHARDLAAESIAQEFQRRKDNRLRP